MTRSIVGNSCKSEVYSLYNDQIRDGALVEVPNSSVLGHNAMKFSLHDPIDLHGFATKDHRVCYQYNDKSTALMANRIIHDIRIWAR